MRQLYQWMFLHVYIYVCDYKRVCLKKERWEKLKKEVACFSFGAHIWTSVAEYAKTLHYPKYSSSMGDAITFLIFVFLITFCPTNLLKIINVLNSKYANYIWTYVLDYCGDDFIWTCVKIKVMFVIKDTLRIGILILSHVFVFKIRLGIISPRIIKWLEIESYLISCLTIYYNPYYLELKICRLN